MEQQKLCVFMPDTADMDKLSELHKAMGDFTRMKILWALMKQGYCVKELAAQMNMSGSAISHQLKILKMEGWSPHIRSARMYSILFATNTLNGF